MSSLPNCLGCFLTGGGIVGIVCGLIVHKYGRIVKSIGHEHQQCTAKNIAVKQCVAVIQKAIEKGLLESNMSHHHVRIVLYREFGFEPASAVIFASAMGMFDVDMRIL
jgi:hypothetical protein